jgi:hypothetical protein
MADQEMLDEGSTAWALDDSPHLGREESRQADDERSLSLDSFATGGEPVDEGGPDEAAPGPAEGATAAAGRRPSSIPSPARASTTISIPSRTSATSSIACRPTPRIGSMSCCPTSGSPRTRQHGARESREPTDRVAGSVATDPGCGWRCTRDFPCPAG